MGILKKVFFRLDIELKLQHSEINESLPVVVAREEINCLACLWEYGGAFQESGKLVLCVLFLYGCLGSQRQADTG